MQRVRKAVGLR